MTASALIVKYKSLGPQSLAVLLHFLADHVYEARLPGEIALRDAGDFKAWLHDLGNAARMEDPNEQDLLRRKVVVEETDGQVLLPIKREEVRPRWTLACSFCGHIHEKECGTCGVDLGGGGVCDCKAEVRA